MTAMTKWVMTAMFGLAMFGAGDAQAAREGGPRHERGAGKLCERIECSAAQEAKIAQIRAAQGPAMKAEKAAIRDLKAQLVAEYKKERVDTTKVQALREQLEGRKAAMKRQHEAMKAQIEAVLTPAQRARLAELKAERGQKGPRGPKGDKAHRGERRGHGKRGGPWGERQAV